MNIDLTQVPGDQLLREVVARSPSILLRKLLDKVFAGRQPSLSKGRASLDCTPFDTLDRSGHASVPLWAGYRNRIKGRWPKFFWPVQVLLELNARVAMPDKLQNLCKEILKARTLPASVAGSLEQLEPVARKYPEHIQSSDIYDPLVEKNIFAIIPTSEDVRKICKTSRRKAENMLRRVIPHGFRVRNSRVLELGCGRGYSTFALGGFDIAEAVGMDSSLKTYYSVAEQHRVRHYFLSKMGVPERTIRFEEGDVQLLPFKDGTFDLVYSFSVLEHISDPNAAFCEMHRVLKPGGFACHSVDPWFSPQGGHSMCILDFPWGHVRLRDAEFEKYITRYRPHESVYALDFYHNSFQSPRLTIGRMESLIIETGFEIVEWRESKTAYENHYPFLNSDVLAESQRRSPDVTVRDLMTSSYSMVLRK